jgi:hypothetical protein
MQSHLFVSVPIGALFFRDPFNPNERLSIKLDSNHARNPQGEIKEVHPHVLVFTGDYNNEIEYDYREDTAFYLRGL